MAAFSTGAPIVKIYHDKSMILPDVSRVLACLYEKDIKFERQTASSYKGLLRLQASNHAPVPFYDGPATFLEESREICRYIAEKYEHNGYPFLLGKDSLERASIEQWLHHEDHAFNPPSQSLFCHLAFRLYDEDDDVDLQKRKLDEVLEIYEQRLSDTEFLAGNKFTLADLVHLPNSHYITASDKFVYLYDSRKNVQRWWNAISTRDSWQKVLKDIKEVEQQADQDEFEKQQQQQWQTEHPTPPRSQTRLHHRKHTSTKSQTILVPPPVDIISTSPMAPQAEKPLPSEIPLDDTLTSNPSSPSSHKSSAVQSKQAAIFSTHIDTPQALHQSTPRIPKKSPISSQRKINFFTPLTSPVTADKTPKNDADNSSIRDFSIPSEATQADLFTKSKPSSSKEVSTNLHVLNFYKASSRIDEAGPDIESTPQETSEMLDKFYETDGPRDATIQAKISPSSANEDPDQLRASMSDEPQDKEPVRYTDHTPQRPAEIIYGRYNTQRGTDASPGKLLSTEAHQELKAEQWHAATAALTNLKGETDHIMPTQQVKHRKDVQQYSSQDSKQPSIHPRAQEPASMDDQLDQGPKMTTRAPHTDQRRDVSSVLWQRTANTREISDDEVSSDHRGAGLTPYTRKIPEAPKIVPADRRKDAPLQKRARDGDSQATPLQTAYDDPHDITQEATETTYAPRQTRAEAHDTSIGTGTYNSVPPRPPPTNASHDDVPPSKQAAFKGHRHVTTPYPGTEDPAREARESPASRPTVPHDTQACTDAEDTVKSSSSEAQLLHSRLVDSFPPNQFLDEDGHGAVSPFQTEYTDDQHNKKQARHPSASRKVVAQDAHDAFEETAETLDYRQVDAPPRRQPPAKNPGTSTSPFQKRYLGDEDTTKQPRPRNMAAQEIQDNSEETKAGGFWSSREQPSDTWQAPGPLPRHEADDTRSTTTPFRETHPHTRGTAKEVEDIIYMPWPKAGEDTKGTFEEIKFAESASSRDQPLDYQRTNDPSRKQEATEHPPGATSPLRKRYADAEGTSKHSRDTSFKPRKMEGGDVQDTSEEADAHNLHLAQHLDDWRLATTPSNQSGDEDALGMSESPPTRYARSEETSKQPRVIASRPTHIAAQDARDTLKESNIADFTSSIEQPSDAQALAPLPNKKDYDAQRYPDTEGHIKEGQGTFEEAKNIDSTSSQVQPLKSQGADAQSRKKEAAEDSLRATSPFRKRHPDVENTTKQSRDNTFKRGKIVGHDAQGIQVETESGDFVLPREQPSDTWQAAATPKPNEASQDGSRLTPPSEKRSPTNEGTSKQSRAVASTPTQIAAQDARDGLRESSITDSSSPRKKPSDVRALIPFPNKRVHDAQRYPVTEGDMKKRKNTFEEAKTLDSASSQVQPLKSQGADAQSQKKEVAEDYFHANSPFRKRHSDFEETTKQSRENNFKQGKIVGHDTQGTQVETEAGDFVLPRDQPSDTWQAAATPTQNEATQDLSRLTPSTEKRYPTNEETIEQPRDAVSTPRRIKAEDENNKFQTSKHADSVSSRKQPLTAWQPSVTPPRQDIEDSHDTTAAFRKTNPYESWSKQASDTAFAPRKNGAGDTKYISKDTKVDDSASPGAKPTYASRAALPLSDQGKNEEHARDKGGESRYAISEPEEILSRDSQYTPVGIKTIDSTSREQSLDRAQASSLSRETAAEDATDATRGDIKSFVDETKNSQDFKGTQPKKSESTLQGPNSRLPTTQSLGAQDPERTNGSSRTPSGELWMDVSTQLQSDVKDIYKEPNSASGHQKGLGSPLSQAEAGNEDQAITGEKIFFDSQVTSSKTQPTDSQGPIKVNQMPSVYQEDPLVARDHHEEAQTLSTGDRADGSVPKRRQAPVVLSTSEEKSTASAPPKGKVHDDHSAEEPSKRGTVVHRKEATPLLVQEPPFQVQRGTEMLQEAVNDEDTSSKLSTIDQWRRASTPSQDVTPNSGDNELGVSSIDQKLTPTSQKEIISAQDANEMIKSFPDQIVEQPAATRAQTSDGQRASPSIPGAARDEIPGVSVQMQEPTWTARPREAPHTRETGDQDLVKTSDGLISKASKVTDDSAIVSEDICDTSLPANDDISESKTATSNANEAQSSGTWPDSILAPVNARLSTDDKFRRFLRDKGAQPPESAQAQTPLEAQNDSASTQNVPSDLLQVTKFVKLTSTEGVAPTAEPASTLEAQLDVPLQAEADNPEYKLDPSDKRTAHAAPSVELESVKEEASVSATDQTKTPQTIFRQQTRPPAPITRELSSVDTQHDMKKIQELTLDMDAQHDATSEVSPAAKKFTSSDQDSVNFVKPPSLVETRKGKAILSATEQTLPTAVDQQETRGRTEGPTSDIEHSLPEQKFAPSDQDVTHTSQLPSSIERMNEDTKDSVRSSQPLNSVVPDQINKSTTFSQQDISEAPGISKSPTSGTYHAAGKFHNVAPDAHHIDKSTEQEAISSTPDQSTDLDTQLDSARGEVLPAAKKFAPSDQDSVNSAQRPSLAETRKEETLISAAEQILPRVIGQQDTQGTRDDPTSDTQHTLHEQKIEQDSAHSRQQPSSAEQTNEEIKDSARSAQPLHSALPDQTKKSTTVGQQDISLAPETSESLSSEPLFVIEKREEEPRPIIGQQDTRNASGISEPMPYDDRDKKFVPRNGQVYHFQPDSEPHEVSPSDVEDVKRITSLGQTEISDEHSYSLPASVDVDLSSGNQLTPDTREAGDQEFFNSSDGQIPKASKATHDSVVIHEDDRDTSLSTNDNIADSKTAASNANEAQGSGTWPDSTPAPSSAQLATDDDFRRFLRDKRAQPPESAQAQTLLEARSDSVSPPNVPSDVLKITKFGKPASNEDVASAVTSASTLETQLAAPLQTEADHPEKKLAPSDNRTARAAEPLPSVELESLNEDASVSAADETKTPQTVFSQQIRPPAPITREVPSADTWHDKKKIQEVTPDNHITDDSAKSYVRPTSGDMPGILPGKGADSPTAIQATNSEDLLKSASIQDRPANVLGNVKKLTPHSSEQEAISSTPDQVLDLDAQPDHATGDLFPAAKKVTPSDQDLVNSVKQLSPVEIRKENAFTAAVEETLPRLDTRSTRETPASDIRHSLPKQKFTPSDQDLSQTTQLPSFTERLNEETKDSARSSQPLNFSVPNQIKKPTTIGQQDISHAPGISKSLSSGAHHAPGEFQDVASDPHHIDNSIPSEGNISRLTPDFEPSELPDHHVHNAVDDKTLMPPPSQAQSSYSKPDSTQYNDERPIRFLPNEISQQREETRAATLPMGLNKSRLAQGVPADSSRNVKSLEPPLIDQEATIPRVASDLTPGTDHRIVPEEVDPTRQKLILKDQDITLSPALHIVRGPSSDSQPASRKIQETNPEVHRIDGPIPSQEQVPREGPAPDPHGAVVQEPNTHTTGPKSAPQTQQDMVQGEISSDGKKFEVLDKYSDRGSQMPASAESTEEVTDAIVSDQNMAQQITFGHQAIMPPPGTNEASGKVLEVGPGDHQSSELTKPPISQKQDYHAGHSEPYEGSTPDLGVGEKTPSPLVSQIHSVEAGSKSSGNDDVHLPTSRDKPVTELRREQEMQPAPVFQASLPSKASADVFGKVEPLKATSEVTPADQSIGPLETFSPVDSRKEESTLTEAKQRKSSQAIIGQQDTGHVPEVSESLLDDDHSEESVSWKEQISHDQRSSEPHEASTLNAQHAAPVSTDQTNKSTTVGQQDISPATGTSESPSSEPLSNVELRKEDSQPIIGQQGTWNAPGIAEPMLDDGHNKKSVSRNGQVYQYQRASEPDEISPPDVQDAKRITTSSQEKHSNAQSGSLQASVDVDPSSGHQSTTRSSPDQWAQLPERTKSPPFLEASIYSESAKDVPKSSKLPTAPREFLSPTVVPAPTPNTQLGTKSGQDLTRFAQPPFTDKPKKEATSVAVSDQTTDGRTIIGEQAEMSATDKGKATLSESYTQHALTKIQGRTSHDDLTDESVPGQEQASLAELVSEPRGGTNTDSHGVSVDESITTSPYSQEKLSKTGSDSGPTRPTIHPSSDDETDIRTIAEQGVPQPAIAQDVSFDSSVKGKSTTQEVMTPPERLVLALDTQPGRPQGEVGSSEHKHAITDVSSQPPFSVEPHKQERNIAAADQQNSPQTIDRQTVPDTKKFSREIKRSDLDVLHASELVKTLNVTQEQVPHAESASHKQGPTLDVGGTAVDENVAFPSSQSQNSDIRPASTPINGDAQAASGDGPATSSLTVSQAQQSAGIQAPVEAIGTPQIIQSIPADSLGGKEFAGPPSTDEEVLAPTTSPTPAKDVPQGTARGEAIPAEPKLTLLDQDSAHSTWLSPPVESWKQVSSVAKSDPTYVSQSFDGPNVARRTEETESAGSLLPMAGTEPVQPPHEASFILSSDKKTTMTQGDLSKTPSNVSFSGSQTVGQLESGADKGELSEELISSYSRKSLEGTSTEEKAEQKQQSGLSSTRSSEDDNRDTNETVSPTITFGGIQSLPPMENTESTEESREQNKADQTVSQSSQDSEKQREVTEARDKGSDEAENTDLDEYNQKNNRTYQGVQQLSNTKNISKSINEAASGIQTDYKSESGLRTSEESKQQVQTEGKTEDGETKAVASKTEQPKERDLPASSKSVASQSQPETSDESKEQPSSSTHKTGKNPGKLDSSTNDTKSSDKEDNLSS